MACTLPALPIPFPAPSIIWPIHRLLPLGSLEAPLTMACTLLDFPMPFPLPSTIWPTHRLLPLGSLAMLARPQMLLALLMPPQFPQSSGQLSSSSLFAGWSS